MSWNQVIGQHRAKELLRRALKNGQIAHAYIFYGPEGIGKDATALEFAKALNCDTTSDEACDKCSSCAKAQRFQHPNIKMVYALPVGKTEKKGDDPIQVLSEEQLEGVHEQLRLKSENHYHRISVPRATFIKINSVRELKRQSAMSMFEKGRKVFLLFNADEMNEEASNSLLKTLQEPSRDTVLVLTTSHREMLLPTILSRCQIVPFDSLEVSDIREHLVSFDGIDRDQAELIAKLSEGSYARARELLSIDVNAERKEVVQFVRSALSARPSSILGDVERLSAGSNRDEAERSLRLLQVWLRDAMLLQERGTEANGHGADDVSRFVEKFPHANLTSALDCVEASIALVGKNVYLPLILMTLAIDLKKLSTADSTV